MAFSIPLFKEGGSPAGCLAGLKLAIARGWLWRHESGTFVSSPLPVPSCSRDCAAQQHYELQIRLGNVGYRTDAGLCRLYPSSLTGFCHQHSQRLLTGCRRAVGEGPC
jgi:hypothetical protein